MESQPVILFLFVSFVLLLVDFVGIVCCASLRDYCALLFMSVIVFNVSVKCDCY